MGSHGCHTQVAIPIHMARILTYPECVSHHNIEKLRQCVRNGPSKYPGARTIGYPDGSKRFINSWPCFLVCSLSFYVLNNMRFYPLCHRVLMGDYRKRLADELKFGCIVHRHLEDGDIVLFNRQPSLHRMSIMCHRVIYPQFEWQFLCHIYIFLFLIN